MIYLKKNSSPFSPNEFHERDKTHVSEVLVYVKNGSQIYKVKILI